MSARCPHHCMSSAGAKAGSTLTSRVARYAGPRPVSCIYRIDNTDTVNTYCKQPALATGRPTCPYPTRLRNARTVYAHTESTSTYRNLVLVLPSTQQRTIGNYSSCKSGSSHASCRPPSAHTTVTGGVVSSWVRLCIVYLPNLYRVGSDWQFCVSCIYRICKCIYQYMYSVSCNPGRNVPVPRDRSIPGG